MRSRRVQRLFLRYREHADGAALAAVFDATAPRLLELACHLAPDSAAAEDLVQSTFLAAIRDPHRYDQRAPLEAWLYGILWREAQKARRHVSRFVDPADPQDLGVSTELDPADTLAVAELPLVVREALERLPKQEREVLEPFLLEDLRADEIARKLQRSAGTVRSQIHRALGRLRRNLPASLTPMAGMIPIRGLSAVRGEVLTAAGVSPATAAALVGGGLASRVGIGVAALVLASGGWVAVRLAQRASADGPKTAVRLESEESAGSSRQPVVVPAASERAPVPADGARLALSVVNWPSESPVAGLRVELWPRVPGQASSYPHVQKAGETPVAEGVLDANGELELDLPVRQPLRIEMPAQGKGDEIFGSLVPFRGQPFDLEALEPGERKTLRMQVLFGREFSRYGRVVADEDGLPIAGARVLSIGREPSGDAGSEFATDAGNHARWLETGAEGIFELKLTYEQQFGAKLAILAPGRSPMLTRDLGGTSRGSPSEFRLLRSASLHGRVSDDSAQPNARFSVRLSTRCYELSSGEGRADWISESPGVSWGTDCDRDGRFDFPELPARAQLDVKVLQGDKEVLWINGESPDAPRLDPGESRELELRTRTGARVTGVAFDKNLVPVAKHRIWLLRMVIATIIDPGPVGVLISDDSQMVVARTVSDEQGRFTFENVEPGTWWVGIAPPDNYSSPAPSDPVIPLAVQFEVPKGVTSVAVDIRPKNTLPIRGKVLKPDGTPLADAGIYVFKSDDSGPGSGRSGPDGSFEIVPTDPGTWKLRAWAPDQGFADSPVIEARAGDVGVLLRLVPGAGISGHLFGSGSEDHASVEIQFFGRGMDGDGFIRGTVGQEFEFSPLPAGTYDLFAVCEPDRVGLVRGIVTKTGAGTGNVRVELSTAAVLVVKYVGMGQSRSFEAWIGDTLVHVTTSVEKSAARRLLLPAGIVKLRPSSAGSERVLTVRAGTETEVVLDDT
jgi:RNA polymerase sigma-70 factor (ECF subfamily)